MRRAAALHTHAQIRGVRDVRILKVLAAEDLESHASDYLILAGDGADKTLTGMDMTISALRNPDAIEVGDVLRVRENSSQISILYRRGSQANTLFVTERCNSLCLMCSQPPRDDDDSWRIDELRQTIRLIDKNEAQIGFTGGEPTLLGEDFASVLREGRIHLPNTHFHVLTNGRRFADAHLARSLTSAGGDATVWAVPLYADVAAIHDEIVVASGAFEETLTGLYNLAINRARVEIRVVLHALSVPRLIQLASYIYRRMPFVEHVAFMGLEPMGLARANRDRLWIDPVDYQDELAQSVHHLASRGMNVSIYNLPLCVLSEDLWPFARQSISDWKNVIDEPACLSCLASSECPGFFLSADHNWRSRAIHPISMKELPHEMA